MAWDCGTSCGWLPGLAGNLTYVCCQEYCEYLLILSNVQKKPSCRYRAMSSPKQPARSNLFLYFSVTPVGRLAGWWWPVLAVAVGVLVGMAVVVLFWGLGKLLGLLVTSRCSVRRLHSNVSTEQQPTNTKPSTYPKNNSICRGMLSS